MILNGKNVVYVGGFGGIGFAACKQLMRRDIASLTIFELSNRPELLKELKELNPSVEVAYVQMDLVNKGSILSAFKDTVNRVRYIDVLINGSGIVNEVDVELCVGVNLIGVINSTLAAVPLMDKSLDGRGGLILNISSLLGMEPAPSNAVYCATKHGVIGFARSLSHDFYFQRTGIMMMLLCPGATSTPMVESVNEKSFTFPYSDQVRHIILNSRPQAAEECASSLMKAIESAKNGAIWIASCAELREVQMHSYV